MVLFSCLAFILFLLFPMLSWLVAIVSAVTGYCSWRTVLSRTPRAGTVLMLPKENFVEIQSQTINFKGQLIGATIWFDSQIALKIMASNQAKQQIFLTRRAIPEADWRLLCRTALQAN
ncbi:MULTISPECIES: protein YgfX [Pseudoalteromonas]|uniref:protein YgfX n=1 Tax=Pseudoalteromonas TaxID=53246 RepID=UPI0030D316A2